MHIIVFCNIHQLAFFILCMIALCSSAAIDSVAREVSEVEPDDQVEEAGGDLSTAESANPQYLGKDALTLSWSFIV